MTDKTFMTPAQFKKHRARLKLSARRMGLAMGLTGDPGRTVRKYEAGDIEIAGPAATAVLALASGFRPPWFPEGTDDHDDD